LKLRTPLLAIGAVLLLIGAILLPVSAAGPSFGNPADCENCNGKEMYQHKNATMQQSGAAGDITVNPAGDDSTGLTQQNMLQYRHRIASGTEDDSTQTSTEERFTRGENQKQQGKAEDSGKGDLDRTRTRSHLQDGSCGNCSNL
jgi:hypothetical protein